MENFGHHELSELLEEFRDISDIANATGGSSLPIFPLVSDKHITEQATITDTYYIAPESHPIPGRSFPRLADELSTAQEAQLSELHEKEVSLLKLKEELMRGKDRLEEIHQRIASTTKAICLARDDSAKLKSECDRLQKDMELKIASIGDYSAKLRELEHSRCVLEALCGKYSDKMNSHRKKTAEVEKTSAAQIELEEAKESLSRLLEQRLILEGASDMKGPMLEELMDQKATMEATRDLLAEENVGLLSKLANVNASLEGMRTEMKLAKKKQQAQVIRLRRQLQEAQARRQQWREKADQLKASIRQFKLKIEE